MHTASRKFVFSVNATRFLVAVVFAGGLLLAGCDSSGSNSDSIVEGEYSGAIIEHGFAKEFVITFSEKDGQVSGNGTFGASGSLIAITVSGIHNHPHISLTFSSTVREDFNFSGDVSDSGDQFSGELNGAGFNNQEVTFTRE